MTDRTVTDATGKAVERALTIAKDNGQSQADALHMAVALFENDDSIGARVCLRTENGPEVTTIRRELQKVLLKKPSQQPAPMESSPSTSFQKMIQRASKSAKANGDSLIALDHLLMALYEDSEVKDILTNAGLTKKIAQKTVDELRGGKKVTSASAEEQYEALEKYGIDLIKEAEKGKLDPVIGRDEEIRRLIQILSRRTKNNPGTSRMNAFFLVYEN